MQIQKINFVNSIAETMQLLLDPLFLLFNKHKSILIGELYYRNSFEILYIVYIQYKYIYIYIYIYINVYKLTKRCLF